MFARALIVVLVALNLGVAAWWLSRPVPPPPPLPVSDKGGVELRLLPPGGPAAVPAPGAAAPSANTAVVAGETPEAVPATAATAIPAAKAACLRLGPFADRSAAEVARAGLGALLRDAALDETPDAATGYRVLLPPAPDRAQAQATAARIAAAGFQDFFVLTQGADANAIALGAYRGRETAERRVAELRAAGFPVELRAQGASGASRWWLQGSSADPDAVRTTFPGAREVDCAALR